MNTVEMTLVQDVVVSQILLDLHRQRWSFVKCGQQSGKTRMIRTLITRGKYACVHKYSPLGGRTIENNLALQEARVSTVLVVIEDALFFSNSYSIYEDGLANGADVLVISSRGPEYDNDLRWRNLKGHSFNTWDLNPECTRASLQQAYLDDPLKAARDYEAF